MPRALRNLASAKAKAGERLAADATFAKAIRSAEGIKESYGKACSLRFIAVEQAKAGDMERAKSTFASALRAADALDPDRRVSYGEFIATGQAETGGEADALKWAAQLDTLVLRARVLRAVAEGISQRALKLQRDARAR